VLEVQNQEPQTWVQAAFELLSQIVRCNETRRSQSAKRIESSKSRSRASADELRDATDAKSQLGWLCWREIASSCETSSDLRRQALVDIFAPDVCPLRSMSNESRQLG